RTLRSRPYRSSGRARKLCHHPCDGANGGEVLGQERVVDHGDSELRLHERDQTLDVHRVEDLLFDERVVEVERHLVVTAQDFAGDERLDLFLHGHGWLSPSVRRMDVRRRKIVQIVRRMPPPETRCRAGAHRYGSGDRTDVRTPCAQGTVKLTTTKPFDLSVTLWLRLYAGSLIVNVVTLPLYLYSQRYHPSASVVRLATRTFFAS